MGIFTAVLHGKCLRFDDKEEDKSHLCQYSVVVAEVLIKVTVGT